MLAYTRLRAESTHPVVLNQSSLSFVVLAEAVPPECDPRTATAQLRVWRKYDSSAALVRGLRGPTSNGSARAIRKNSEPRSLRQHFDGWRMTFTAQGPPGDPGNTDKVRVFQALLVSSPALIAEGTEPGDKFALCVMVFALSLLL